MAALALDTDVEDRLGRDLTTAEDQRVGGLLDDASAAVRSYTGQQFEQATSTDEHLRVRRGIVRLPQRPVTAVSSVKDINDNAILFTWDGLDRIRTSPNLPNDFAFEPWASPIQVVKVTYTHGYVTIPDDIIGITCSMVMRALGVDPTNAGTVQEAAGPFSRTVGSIGAAGALGLLPAEREILDRYKRVGGFVQMGPW